MLPHELNLSDTTIVSKIFENALDLLTIASLDGYFLKLSKSWEDVLGYSRVELCSKPWAEFLHPEDRNSTETARIRLNKGEVIMEFENRYRAKDGKYHWISWKSYPDTEEGIIYAIARDITREKEFQSSEKTQDIQYRLLFEHMKSAFAYHRIELDDAGKPNDYTFLDINDAFCKMTGLKKENVIGKKISEILPSIRNEYVKWVNIYGEVALNRQTRSFESFSESLGKYYLITAYSPHPFYFVTLFNDITIQKEKAKEEFQNQKLTSVAQLAGGIAHDFNNLLVGILGNINLLQIESDFSDEKKEILKDLESATIQAKNLTQQLLTFSRGGQPIKKMNDIIDVIKKSANFILRGKKSTIKYDFPPKVPNFLFDAGQLNQVFNNLFLNADQAMQNGEILVKISFAQENSIILIQITDSGRGIPFELQSHIFEPYFTTKKEGTGLGLATAYSIIKQHGGTLSFVSHLGVGTTFQVKMPLLFGKEIMIDPTAIASTLSSQNEVQFLEGKVLVMDDDPHIQRSLQRYLDALGLECSCAFDGDETLSLLHLHSDFNVVIMDLIIPGKTGGKETIMKIREEFPDLPVIVSSGYSNDPIMSNYSTYGFSNILEKPYTINQLYSVLSLYCPKKHPDLYHSP